MFKRKNITVNKLRLSNEITPSYVAKTFKNTKYGDEGGYGFKENEIDDSLLSSILIKRNSTFIMDYDVNSGGFEKKQIFIFSEITFQIDFDRNIICVFGNSTALNQVKAILRILMPNSLEFSADLDAYTLFRNLKTKNRKVRIEELIIPNFEYRNGVVGKYYAKISDSTIATELLMEYKGEILKIGVGTHSENGDELKIILGNNGSISIICEEEDFSENVNYLFTQIF